MLTEREEKLIDAYLPHGRDPELGKDEYYVKDTAGRIHKVYICDILPSGLERITYGVREVGTGRRIDAGYGSEWVGFSMSALYDNKIDCRDETHILYDGWEHLRERMISEAYGH